VVLRWTEREWALEMAERRRKVVETDAGDEEGEI